MNISKKVSNIRLTKIKLIASFSIMISCVCYGGDWVTTNPDIYYNGGNVGIGTSNPHNKLEIGSAFSFHEGGHFIIGLGHASNFGSLTSEYSAEIRLDKTAGKLRLGVSDAQNSDPSTDMTITKTGNIGIGTTDPHNKLEIGSAFSFHEGGHFVLGIGYATNFGSLTSNYSAEIRLDKSTGRLRLGVSDVQNSNPTTDMTITETGNVGIGTIDPHEKLTVDGKIVAEEVIVKESQNWPDYVFEPNYALPSLDEVEEHIATYKHLPDIPSATEVAEQGLSMSAMLTKQMQKIEELTLYLIDQNKKMDKVLEENETLKRRLTTIEQSL